MCFMTPIFSGKPASCLWPTQRSYFGVSFE